MPDFQHYADQLIDAGRQLYRHGMVPATSGNFSARLDDNTLAITVSGRHKGKLGIDDIMRVDATGKSLDGKKPSAETLLHVGIYRHHPQTRVVLHPHSVAATLLSRISEDWLVLQDYEILKAFPGIDTHACQVNIPVFDNDQDIERLAAKVEPYLQESPQAPGYLIRGHGFYTWGNTMEDVLRHVEAFEFLFECELRLRGVR